MVIPLILRFILASGFDVSPTLGVRRVRTSAAFVVVSVFET